MSKKTYYELLQDPRWQRRRLEIMNLAGFACQWCESTEKTLNVHHKIYRKGVMPWEYSDSELLCLCNECHELHHGWKRRLDEAIARLDSGDFESLVGYAEGRALLSEHMYGKEQWPSLQIRSFEHCIGVVDALWEWNAAGAKHLAANQILEKEFVDDAMSSKLGMADIEDWLPVQVVWNDVDGKN